jgi:hypothetical protein
MLEEPMTEERTDESEITDDLIKKFEGTKQLAQKHFYFLIGLSITAWSSMEGFLVHVAAMLLDTDAKKAGLVLYSTGFHSWLSIISDLFNLDPSYHPVRSDWNKIECSATIWMGTQRQSGWPFWRSRREDDCRGPTITQAIFA